MTSDTNNGIIPIFIIGALVFMMIFFWDHDIGQRRVIISDTRRRPVSNSRSKIISKRKSVAKKIIPTRRRRK